MNALKNKFGLIVFILFMLALATMLGVLFTAVTSSISFPTRWR